MEIIVKVFGILNVTPDSFSDGGEFFSPQAALARAQSLITEGAYAIDVGAESTRPGAKTATPEMEWQRLEPILPLLKMPISLDTRHPETAARALAYKNVKYLNDVTGFENPEMVSIAAKGKLNIIVMHSLSVPANKYITLRTPPVDTLIAWIKQKNKELNANGIASEKIIFDPGIGFGKTPEQSRELIDSSEGLAGLCHSLGCKILYGHSRKSFLGGDIGTRDLETARISVYLQNAGVDYIRVHNIEMNINALNKQETGN